MRSDDRSEAHVHAVRGKTDDARSASRQAAEAVVARLEEATPARPIALGRYDVTGHLGRGGMGTVYEGVDRERGMRVAVKTLLALDPAAGVQIKREFRTMSDLAHPSLAAVYELACEDGLWFFAMERIDGVDLRRWARGGTSDASANARAAQTPSPSPRFELPTRPEGEAEQAPRSAVTPESSPASLPLQPMDAIRAAFAELVDGLSALHDAGLWHGDIKPGNVLVRQDGRVVVVDFGLARPVSDAQRPPGPTSGTPSYMAPEQLVGSDVGPASDWYAVGTMLYELLTGRMPFGAGGGASHVELYIRKTLQTPPSPRELLPEIPAELSDACMALLRPVPAARPSREGLAETFAGRDGPGRGDAGTWSRARSVFVGRALELKRLERAYARTRSGPCSLVHVHGPSGIGKSAMVRSFLRGVRDVAGAEVLQGRCYERESVPYKAFDGIVDALAAHLDGRAGAAIDGALPAWAGELAQAFPALTAVPAIAALAARVGRLTSVDALDAKELRRRAWTALRELVDVVARGRTIVLWIDDLQWADADSAELLASLLRESHRAPVLVIASYRRAEAAKNELLAGYFEAAAEIAAAGDLLEVTVGALSAAEGEELARATLDGLAGSGEAPRDGGASRARAREVAIEAAGVPFFIEELARFVASKGIDATAAAGALPANASLDDAIAARLGALPPEQRAIVETVAVADSPIAQSVVFEAAGLDADAIPGLLALRSASMLSWTGPGTEDLVSAYHDRIREAVVAGLSRGATETRHLALARALSARHAPGTAGSWLFDTVRHFGAAGAALVDPAERLAAARLHLDAGRAARKGAAFPLAAACFEGGIALLPENGWGAEYDLALALHCGAAEAAYLSATRGSRGALERRVADVKSHGKTTMDQLVAWEVEIDALAGRHEYMAAVDTAMEALELLGVRLPRSPGETETRDAFERALEALTRAGPEGLAAMPDVSDPEVAAAMRIQIRVSPAAYFAKPSLLPILASNLVTTSVTRGLSAATPYALALFGLVLNAAGMFPVSHPWGELAVRLIDRWEDRSLEAATRHVVFNLVCPWMVPLATTLEPLREVFEIGRRTGDLEYAAYAAHGYTHNAMYAGRPLAPLLAEAHALTEQMRALGQVNALHVHAPFEQLLKCWTGKLPDPARLDGEGFDEESVLATAAADGSRSGICVTRVAMGLARFHFGDPLGASACFEIGRDHLDAAPSVWHVPILHQFAALSACAAWEAIPRAGRAPLRARIQASVDALRILAGHAPVNFAHRLSLVEGELCRIDGDLQGARARFERGAREATTGGWVNDAALAHELGAGCAERIEGAKGARALLVAARAGYAAWGATAKVARLDVQLAALPGGGGAPGEGFPR